MSASGQPGAEMSHTQVPRYATGILTVHRVARKDRKVAPWKTSSAVSRAKRTIDAEPVAFDFASLTLWNQVHVDASTIKRRQHPGENGWSASGRICAKYDVWKTYHYNLGLDVAASF